MKIAYFPNQIALNAKPVLDAFLQGCAWLDIETVPNSMDADAAVIWSVLWHGRMRENESIYRLYRQQNKPVFVLEVGMLRRGSTWKLGLNGTWAGCYPGKIKLNRAEELGLSLEPWRDDGINIVVACQRSDSEQWASQPPSEVWLNDTVRSIRQHSERPIIIRPHPRQRITNIPGAVIEQPKSLVNTYDGFDYDRVLNQAWAVVNHNSGPGAQAIIAGVPAFVGSTSLALPVANTDLAQIENPQRPDRQQWLNELAHSEWTVKELATGNPLNRLLHAVPSFTLVDPS